MEQDGKKPIALRFSPSRMSREYGSNIYITKGDKTDRIQFRTRVIYAGVFMDQYPIFHLYKHDLYINKTAPDEHSYRLAAACAKTFYPIVVLCDREGQIVGVRNDLIQQRWQKQKPNIEREFVGEYAERYIKETDRNIMNKDKVLDLISKDLFFNSFFAIKYGFRFELEREIDKKMSFFAFKSSLTTKGIQQNSVGEYGILVKHTGQIVDNTEFSYNSLLSAFENLGYGKVLGNYTIDYELNLDLQTIDSILFDAILTKEDGTDLIQVKMESYFLSEYPQENIEDNDTIQLGKQIEKEEAKLQKKNRKPLWQRFKDHLNEPL